MRNAINLFMLATFLAMAAFFPARASTTRAGAMAMEIFARLYRNLSAPDIQNFSADFYSKTNPSPEYVATTHEEDLTPFSKGRVYFKKPFFLRVESTLLAPGLSGADFVLIRNGKLAYAYKNGVDFPIGETTDNPGQPSNLVPFGLQLPILPQDLQVVLLGQTSSLGVKSYILGLMDRTDPDHDIIKVWVDGTHFFVRRAEWYEVRQQKSNMQIVSSDGNISIYKNAVVKMTLLCQDPLRLPNGYWIPMRMERYQNWTKNPLELGSLAQVVVYSKASVNGELPDTLFEAQTPSFAIPFSTSTFQGENQ